MLSLQTMKIKNANISIKLYHTHKIILYIVQSAFFVTAIDTMTIEIKDNIITS